MVFYGLNNLNYPPLTSSNNLLQLTNQNQAHSVHGSGLLGAGHSAPVSGLNSAIPAPNGGRFAFALGTGMTSHAPAANHLLATSASAALLRKLITSPLLVSLILTSFKGVFILAS